MKNLNLFYTAAFVFVTAFATAQGINQSPVYAGQISAKKEQSQKASGSMFINEKYMPARVSNLDGTVLVRYNAYGDAFQISDPVAGTEKAIPQQKDVTITFLGTGEVFSLQQYVTEKEEVKTGYLSLVSDNPNVKIYKRERIFLQPEIFPASSYQTYKPAVYKKMADEFYVKIKGQDAVFISGKKDLAKLVPAKSKEILDFIKKNKLDLEKEADLQQVGVYLEGNI